MDTVPQYSIDLIIALDGLYPLEGLSFPLGDTQALWVSQGARGVIDALILNLSPDEQRRVYEARLERALDRIKET